MTDFLSSYPSSDALGDAQDQANLEGAKRDLAQQVPQLQQQQQGAFGSFMQHVRGVVSAAHLDGLEGAWEGIKSATAAARDNAQASLDAVGGEVHQLGQGVGQTIEGAGQHALQQIGDGVGAVTDAIKQAAPEAGAAVAGAVGQVASDVGTAVRAFTPDLGAAAQGLGQQVQEQPVQPSAPEAQAIAGPAAQVGKTIGDVAMATIGRAMPMGTPEQTRAAMGSAFQTVAGVLGPMPGEEAGAAAIRAAKAAGEAAGEAAPALGEAAEQLPSMARAPRPSGILGPTGEELGKAPLVEGGLLGPSGQPLPGPYVPKLSVAGELEREMMVSDLMHQNPNLSQSAAEQVADQSIAHKWGVGSLDENLLHPSERTGAESLETSPGPAKPAQSQGLGTIEQPQGAPAAARRLVVTDPQAEQWATDAFKDVPDANAKVDQFMQQWQTAGDASQRLELIQGLNKLAASPEPWWEKGTRWLAGFMTGNMLSGTRTMEVMGLHGGTAVFAPILDRFLTGTGPEVASAGRAAVIMGESFGDALAAGLRAAATGRQELAASELLGRAAAADNPALAGTSIRANILGRPADALHEFWRTVAERGAMSLAADDVARQTGRSGIEVTSDPALLDRVIASSRDISYEMLHGSKPGATTWFGLRGPDPMTGLLNAWKNRIYEPGMGNKVAGLVGNVVFPFVDWPMFATRKGLGILASPTRVVPGVAKLAAGDIAGASADFRVAAAGSLTLGYLNSQIMQGNITGAGPNPNGALPEQQEYYRLLDAKDAMGDAAWRPNSVRIADPSRPGHHVWMSYSSAGGPLTMPMEVMANAHEAWMLNASRPGADVIPKVGMHVLRGVMDGTVLRDVMQLMSAINGERTGVALARQNEDLTSKALGAAAGPASELATRLIPGGALLRQIAGYQDPRDVETGVRAGLGNRIVAGIPDVGQTRLGLPFPVARTQLPARPGLYNVQSPASALLPGSTQGVLGEPGQGLTGADVAYAGQPAPEGSLTAAGEPVGPRQPSSGRRAARPARPRASRSGTASAPAPVAPGQEPAFPSTAGGGRRGVGGSVYSPGDALARLFSKVPVRR